MRKLWSLCSTRLAVALALYLTILATYAVFVQSPRLVEHTQFNHFSLLAEGWLNGGLDLGRRPPDYAQNNDFAVYKGKYYVTFPGFPALLLLPLVKLAGAAERVRDGQFFLWLAPVGPTLLYLTLERLREVGLSRRSHCENLALTALFAFGTVYFFTAVQGTVWFAAHVVGVALLSAYLLFGFQARKPVWAGVVLALGFWTRSPLLFAVPFFFLEAWRVCQVPGQSWQHVDRPRLMRLNLLFLTPVGCALALALFHNWLRFDSPFDFGYRHLQIAWRARMERWGLMHYHFLPRNLGVVLTSLPWVDPFKVNLHGLALWITTPAYLWLIRARRASVSFAPLMVTAACVSVPTLFYQNSGWQQFGYRFSNDYSPLLFVGLALSGVRMGRLFWLAAVWAIGVNTWGAWTFDRPDYSHRYFQDPSQRILYQPD